MSRIPIVERDTATSEQRALLDAVEARLGGVPNFLGVLANSPAALRGFLGLHGIAGEGSLDAQTRERIALALAQRTGCAYCLSAHTVLGGRAGLDGDEIDANRSGTSTDDRAAVAVEFALALAEHTGEITTSELNAVRDAGYGDAEIVEIIAHVGMNLLSNIVGKASRVAIDFPEVSLDRAA